MSCLGERLTALVDGELGHEERDRALAHLAGCTRCRSEADSLRRLKSRLRGLGDLPTSGGADDLPSTDFLTRLRGLAEPDTGAETGADTAGTGTGTGARADAGAVPDHVPAGMSEGVPEAVPGGIADRILDRVAAHDARDSEAGTGAGWVVPDPSAGPPRGPSPRGERVPFASPLHSRPRDNRPAARPVAGRGAAARSSRRYLAVGAASLVIGLGAASYGAGGQREAPTVSPAFDRFAVEHALTSGDVPMTDPVDDRTTVPPAPGP